MDTTPTDQIVPIRRPTHVALIDTNPVGIPAEVNGITTSPVNNAETPVNVQVARPHMPINQNAPAFNGAGGYFARRFAALLD